MRRSSYINDWGLLARATADRNDELLFNAVENQKNTLDWYAEEDDHLFGFRIESSESLSNVFGFKTFMVNFFFKNVAFDFDQNNVEVYKGLILNIKKKIDNIPGYYILRVPTSNVNLIDSINNELHNTIFCGSSVLFLCTSAKDETLVNDGIVVQKAGENDIAKNKETLLKMGFESFSSYFGQYHISRITRDKAPILYENWTKEYIEDGRGTIIVAKDNQKVAGFLACEESQHSFEMVLSAVDENYRGNKIYERMIREGTRIALEKNKIATLATQVNNYPVQRAWINIGFKPYFSFYMMHINCLRLEG